MMGQRGVAGVAIVLMLVCAGAGLGHDGMPTEPKGTFIPGQTAGFGSSAAPTRDMLAGYGGFAINTGGRISNGEVQKFGNYQSVGVAVLPTYTNGSGYLQGSDIDPGGMLPSYPDRFFGWTHVEAHDQQVQYTAKLDNAVLNAGLNWSVGTDFSVSYLGKITDDTQPDAPTLQVDLSYHITGLLKTSEFSSAGFGYALYIIDAETHQAMDGWEGFFSQSGVSSPFVQGFGAGDYQNMLNGFSETVIDAQDDWTATLEQGKEYIISGSAFAIGDTFSTGATYESDFGETIVTTITPNAANPNAVFTIIPEPASMTLILLGGAAMVRRRRG